MPSTVIRRFDYSPQLQELTVEFVTETSKLMDTPAGVLYIVNNYTGDRTAWEMAKEIQEAEGQKIGWLLVNDDVAVENSTHTTGRRGVAGTVVVEKMVGAAAEAGADLAQGVARGEQQRLGPHPRDDVGDLHHVRPADDSVQAVRAGEHFGSRERRQRQHPLHAHRRGGRDRLTGWQLRGTRAPIVGNFSHALDATGLPIVGECLPERSDVPRPHWSRR